MIGTIIHFLRVVFGLIFLFFIPGYAITLALFPKKDDLTLIERIGFAGILSILADILTALIMDVILNIPLTGFNIFLALLTLTFIMFVVWRVEVYFIDKKSI